MPFTRFGLEGYGVRRVGSFAGKTTFLFGPHPVSIITRFGLDAYGVRRAGSFTGKTTEVISAVLDEWIIRARRRRGR